MLKEADEEQSDMFCLGLKTLRKRAVHNLLGSDLKMEAVFS